MGVMHDACHGAYSRHKKLNHWLGYSMNILGGNKFNWIIQHNVKHHTFTNVFGKDEDLENGNVIRMSPYADWKPIHRFQHLYSWFLYSLGTLSWVTLKDFKQLYAYQKEVKNKQLTREWLILIITKIIYYFFMIAVPLMVLDVHWGWVVAGFLIIHMTGGLILSITFQLAHLVEGLNHEEDPYQSEMGWAEHQLMTTSNFARGNPVLTWFMGGLNHQVEHHLFPAICHVHYPELSKIVRQEARSLGIEYNEHPGFFGALKSHYSTLKKFGARPV
jgi:linoleoyl-CoA desaturase